MLHPTASDEVLIATLERTGNSCIRVMAMPEEERLRPSPKGTNPEQMGVLSAFLWLKTATQLIERGLLPKDFLDGVLD